MSWVSNKSPRVASSSIAAFHSYSYLQVASEGLSSSSSGDENPSTSLRTNRLSPSRILFPQGMSNMGMRGCSPPTASLAPETLDPRP